MTSTVAIPDVEWTSLEKLALVSAVSKKGDDNWSSVSRVIKPYVSSNKNIELFSAKNCALKYDFLLNQTLNNTESESGSKSRDEALKRATEDRIEDLKREIQKLHANCTQLHVELNEVNSGKYNSNTEVAWEEVQNRKHSKDFQPLAKLVADVMEKRSNVAASRKEEVTVVSNRVKEEVPSSRGIKEEVLDEGHSSETSVASNKSEKSSIQQMKLEHTSASPSPVIRSPAHITPATSNTPPRLPSQSSPNMGSTRSPAAVGASPGRTIARPSVSPRIQPTSRIITAKTKLTGDEKSKVKTIKPQKKKPIVPKIKIKALQMAGTIDPKGIIKGDKKENKITDVFHFDYQPPSGSGSNPNAQYSSLFQDPKMASFIDKTDPGPRSEPGSSPAGSSVVSSQTMSPRVDPDGVPANLDTESTSYRSWKKSILLLWKSAAQHKYANIFMHPVTDDLAPGYSATVRRPIDLTTIKKRIDNNQIRTTSQFHRDMLLMFHNAVMYNNASHSVYAMTVEMMEDIIHVIQDFYSTHNQLPDKHIANKSLAKPRSRTSSLASQ